MPLTTAVGPIASWRCTPRRAPSSQTVSGVLVATAGWPLAAFIRLPSDSEAYCSDERTWMV